MSFIFAFDGDYTFPASVPEHETGPEHVLLSSALIIHVGLKRNPILFPLSHRIDGVKYLSPALKYLCSNALAWPSVCIPELPAETKTNDCPA